MDHTRAVRPPPGARRNLFQGTRRQNPTAVRPDTAMIFQQPMEGEMVERNADGDYALFAPQTVYKHMALGLSDGRESDEETAHENQMIELYGQKNAHWDKEAVEAEVKAALKSSLAKKIASIEDDRWMFEGNVEGLGKN
ncbi:uncharacterized protein M421DRAFT_415772 [Didymella exigua CBS 183.55]|uniref:Uncharacterized protein n=1 Tax=Didymella exigua CBS 183.55 TaxID=1150837 RepID=A0A6A5S0W8_9PLEO|nr:uncharacterized protein M421DRAFT_415772 [Didymella exigua CBS 183.55]KAF1933429.1 hypothetical protein M421DRAFT_415772 [Didymella exigua CBS 183.55]